MSDRSLSAGVLAAGRGERLRSRPSDLKPLVRVGHETLIEHVLGSIAAAGASTVTVIINEESMAVRDHVLTRDWPFELDWLIETTPSSMHSFLRLVEALAHNESRGPFLLSTVDTIAGPRVFADFIERARTVPAALTLGLTSPGDDEKPLLVRTSPNNSCIEAFGEGEFATAGIYAVRPIVLREADEARRDGLDALRKFLSRLLDRGYHLTGIPISGSIDVDHRRDIAAAESFLRSL
ncbi:MAG: NDP-sugar synthase [Chthoniobacterales bacterium]